ncbi:MAG TPA: MarR family transcriptional regulator [Pseudonocardiaceae bacterium]|jgi:DNA-binding MarR family transcriptional regulator|nr:MarR family transcriptional regulator [Pseudonocardiaceae bacterium]
MATVEVDPSTDDDEMVSWWGLVIEGYLATQDKVMGQIADEHGLAPASFDILIRLLRSPDHRMPMTRLAREAALSSGGFTKVADRLVKAGLVRREPCDVDRRITYARLTDHGLATAVRARGTCAAVLRRIVLEPLGQERAGALADTMRALRETNQDHAAP